MKSHGKTKEPLQIKGHYKDLQLNVCDPELDSFAIMAFMGET